MPSSAPALIAHTIICFASAPPTINAHKEVQCKTSTPHPWTPTPEPKFASALPHLSIIPQLYLSTMVGNCLTQAQRPQVMMNLILLFFPLTMEWRNLLLNCLENLEFQKVRDITWSMHLISKHLTISKYIFMFVLNPILANILSYNSNILWTWSRNQVRSTQGRISIHKNMTHLNLYTKRYVCTLQACVLSRSPFACSS